MPRYHTDLRADGRSDVRYIDADSLEHAATLAVRAWRNDAWLVEQLRGVCAQAGTLGCQHFKFHGPGRTARATVQVYPVS